MLGVAAVFVQRGCRVVSWALEEWVSRSSMFFALPATFNAAGLRREASGAILSEGVLRDASGACKLAEE